jgi:hypothetical protein
LNRTTRLFSVTLLALLLGASVAAFAGPPYVTDDPEPVEYRHWEVYLASIFTKQPDAWTATAPHIEINYGAVPNVQLHTILPLTLYAPGEGANSYGYGDTELGVKYRFVQESDWRPQIGTFPLLEVPTGSRARNLGSGHLQTFLPIWLQKSVGPWTTYGGAGYWINPGTDKRNWWYTGILIQRSVLPNLAPGFEIFYQTPQEVGGPSETRFSVGFVWDLSDLQHIMASAGRGIEGPNQVQGYLAYQLTFGPYP